MVVLMQLIGSLRRPKVSCGPPRHAAQLAAPLPALEDPNTGFATFGAEQALRYLDEAYRTGDALGWAAPLPAPNLGEARLHPVLSRVLGRG